MPLTIELPGNLDTASMRRFISAAMNDGEPRSDDIILDFHRLDWVDSTGVVILSNIVEWLRKRHVDVAYTGCRREMPAIAYLDDVGFFAAYWGSAISPNARVRSTTYPFRRLLCTDSHQWIDGNVFPWVADRLNVRSSALNEIKTSVRELFNNIADHSTNRSVACMCNGTQM